MLNVQSLKHWGEQLHKKIKQWVGMPVSIGKAATEVLHDIYIPGYQYKKAGVIVMGIGPRHLSSWISSTTTPKTTTRRNAWTKPWIKSTRLTAQRPLSLAHSNTPRAKARKQRSLPTLSSTTIRAKTPLPDGVTSLS